LNKPEIASKLLADNAISKESYERIEAGRFSALFSLNFELKTLLYCGVLLLSSGIGVLVYKNIDTIGHMAIILFIAAVSAACFVYCMRKANSYSNNKVVSPGILFDYILLFGCLTFVSFLGYLQYEYSVFGNHNDWVALTSALLFFACAYYFDHLGVLSLAITTLATYVGIAITPIELLRSNDFNGDAIIYSGLLLGFALIGLSWALNKRSIKKHFTYTYINFASHMLFVFCLAGLFRFSGALFPLIFFGLVGVVIWQAFSERSFYFLLIAILYGYIGVSYLVINFLFMSNHGGDAGLSLAFLYFISSSIGIIFYLISCSKKLKLTPGPSLPVERGDANTLNHE
jgi:hypothetical protein